MSTFVLHLLIAHRALAYPLVLGLLLACGLGLPLPEDVALVTGGYLTFAGAANLWVMLAVALVGILGGDLLVYAAGRRYGQRLAHTHWLHRHLTDAKLRKVEGYFARHGEGIVFAARFLPGIRVVTYFSAGATELRPWKFLLFDAAAACISAPFWLLTGRSFGKHLQESLAWVEHTRFIILGVAAAVGAALLVFFWRRNGDSGDRAPVPPSAEEAPAVVPRKRTGSG